MGVELASPTWVEARLYDAMLDLSAWQDMPACQTPALLVYGELSGRLGEGRDPAAGVRPFFPRSEVSVMAGCTHSGPMEQPEVFERLIRDFAGKV